MSQRGRQFKISKSAQIILAIIVFGLFFMSQKAQAVLYDPGQTLNPQCLPTDANCDVRPAVSAPTNAAAGSLLYASATSTYAALSIGANGQILKVANGALSWSDDSAYAILNGRVGGQTMIGGTTANSP